MKRLDLLLAVLLFASFAAPALAATPATQTLGANAGLVAPTGDFADLVGAGGFLGASYDYRFNDRWAAGIELAYFSFGEKTTSMARPGGTRSVSESASGGQSQFYAKYFLPMKDDRYEPYVKAGYFHYRVGFKSSVTSLGETTRNTDRETKPGFGIGLGVTRKLDEKSSAGVEFVFSQIQTSGKALDLWQLGATYSFRIGK